MKEPVAKRRFEEILALYKLEPSLKDIYVEGSTDAGILGWFLQRNGQLHVHVYGIQTVDVPAHLFDESGLNPNSTRDHVVLFSEQLDAKLPGIGKRVKCIADADFDRYLAGCRDNPVLLYTDYTSIEMYLFNRPTMEKFVAFILGDIPVSVSQFMKNLGQVLQRIFLLRLANEKLGWSMTWVNVKEYISYSQGRIGFDESRYVNNYLLRNGKKRHAQMFRDTVEGLSRSLEKDCRHNIRGHDLVYVLFLSSHKHLGRRFPGKTHETFAPFLCACLEFDEIVHEPLFVALGRL